MRPSRDKWYWPLGKENYGSMTTSADNDILRTRRTDPYQV